MGRRSTYEKIAARQKRSAKKWQEENPEEKSVSIEDALEAVVGTNILYYPEQKVKNAYQDNYVVFRGINLLADNIAQLPLQIYRGEELMPDDFVFPDGFDLYNPAEDLTLYELLYRSSIYYFYRGEWMNYINLGLTGDRVYSILPANPKKMKIDKKDEMGRILSWEWDHKIIVPNDQLLYVSFYNPDGDRGLGPVEVAINEVLTDKEAVDFNKAFFANYGKTGGVLTDSNGDITATEMEKLVNEFNAYHRGAGNAHKILGLPAGIKYEDVMQTMKEMEFLESRRDIRDNILLTLGVPKSVVGVTDSVDRAVAETAMRSLWRLTIMPNATRIQNKFNQHLFKRYYKDYHCEFDFTGVEELKSSRSEAIEEAKGLRGLGYTLNEIEDRLALGMGQLEGDAGDLRLVPQLLIPMEDYTTDTTVDEKTADNTISKDITIHKTLKRDWHRLQRKYEKRIHGKMKSYFSKQLIRILAGIRGTKQADWDEFAVLQAVKTILQDDNALLIETLSPVYEKGSAEAVGMAQAALNVASNPHAKMEVVGALTNRITGVNDHTYNLIRNQVMAAHEAGETIEQLSKRVQRVGNFNVSRSRLIGRTESNTILSASTHSEYVTHGVKKKQWLTAGDGDVRDTHRQNADAGAIGMNQSFPGTGEMYPSEPNCRCAIAPVVGRE